MAPRLLVFAVILTAVTAISAPAGSQAPGDCQVAGFRGVSAPGGAQTSMRVVNTGQACRLTYFVQRGQPFQSGTITTHPAHGIATATGGGAAYTPNPDYAGPDSFVVAMDGFTSSGRLQGQVTVNVTVLPRR